MKILYHITSIVPPFPDTDAVFQEVKALESRFGGTTINLYPFKRPFRFFPRFLYGIHRRQELTKIESSFDLHHVFHPTPYIFPILKRLKKPIIYSVNAGINGHPLLKKKSLFIHTLVISNKRDEAALQSCGVRNYRLILPGINTSRFSYTPPSSNDFVLLVSSAPWIPQQFKQKGIDALLEAVSRTTNMRLIFLWRGLLIKELEKRIKKFKVKDHVEIINKKTDVNKVLARSHATVVLAESSELVKAYPHSLLESLAAGKPVLTSQAIPMADFVQENRCGEVISKINVEELKRGIERLRENYDDYQKQAFVIGQRDFSLSTMLKAFEQLYSEIRTHL